LDERGAVGACPEKIAKKGKSLVPVSSSSGPLEKSGLNRTDPIITKKKVFFHSKREIRMDSPKMTRIGMLANRRSVP
jgi:hypothetical protein